MSTLNTHKVGLTFAFFSALSHLAWSVTVAAGAGQAVLVFLNKLHFISQPEEKVQAFDAGTAVSLIAFTAAVSYLSGRVMAALWNRLQLRSAHAEYGHSKS